MSKRFYYPQQQSERKRPKLDISISDHNFPLSQNDGNNKETTSSDNWGDDIDDQMLLLASQACEDAYSTNDITSLPNYSICMQPGVTSTQLTAQPVASTSKNEFSFKAPSHHPSSVTSSHLKDKCNRISSPLPRITPKVMKMDGFVNMTEDGLFNDKVFKTQDADYVYKQLLQLQEENAKLKSENGKLLEKCVTKEGEASILRTQLKSCQSAIDSARLDKIKAQEKVQMEMNEKLATANNQIHDLRNQLDFKSLEIISVKEKCKKLASKNVSGFDLSQRNNNSFLKSDVIAGQNKRVHTVSNSVQTDDKAHFLILNKTCGLESTNLSTILPHVLEPSSNQHHSILDYNEKLQKTTDLSQNKCRVYSTFHRLPSTPVPKETKPKVVINNLVEDITAVASGSCDKMEERYFNIFSSVQKILNETREKLETVCQRVTTSFQKEMDEKYIEATSKYLPVTKEDLLKGRPLYKEEQDILSRRMLATLSYIVESSRGKEWFLKYSNTKGTEKFIDNICRICILLDNASCATLYSGLLLSITNFISTLNILLNQTKVLDVIKTILMSRAMPFVVTHLLCLLKNLFLDDKFVKTFCPGNGTGNLKTDYDQGVLLYKKDSCYIQLLLKQIETCLKCIEKQKMVDEAIDTTQNLITLYNNIRDNKALTRQKSRCDCQLILVQVIVYALRICAVLLDCYKKDTMHFNVTACKEEELLSVCRCGIQMLCECALRDVELSTQLSHNEGHLIEFCERMRDVTHSEAYTNMLSELSGTLQSSPEDMPPSFHKQPWLHSFDSFSLTD